MADERQELDRLRKVKRLRELEAREVQNVNIPDGGLGVPNVDSVIQQIPIMGIRNRYKQAIVDKLK